MFCSCPLSQTLQDVPHPNDHLMIYNLGALTALQKTRLNRIILFFRCSCCWNAENMNSYHILYLFNLPRSEQCRKEIRESREKKNTKETLVRIKTIKGWKHTNKQWNLLFEKSEPTFPKKDLKPICELSRNQKVKFPISLQTWNASHFNQKRLSDFSCRGYISSTPLTRTIDANVIIFTKNVKHLA